jgi:hypothetical protein
MLKDVKRVDWDKQGITSVLILVKGFFDISMRGECDLPSGASLSFGSTMEILNADLNLCC